MGFFVAGQILCKSPLYEAFGKLRSMELGKRRGELKKSCSRFICPESGCATGVPERTDIIKHHRLQNIIVMI